MLRLAKPVIDRGAVSSLEAILCDLEIDLKTLGLRIARYQGDPDISADLAIWLKDLFDQAEAFYAAVEQMECTTPDCNALGEWLFPGSFERYCTQCRDARFEPCSTCHQWMRSAEVVGDPPGHEHCQHGDDQ